MCLTFSLWAYLILSHLGLLDIDFCFLHQIRKVLLTISSNNFSGLFSYSFWDIYNMCNSVWYCSGSLMYSYIFRSFLHFCCLFCCPLLYLDYWFVFLSYLFIFWTTLLYFFSSLWLSCGTFLYLCLFVEALTVFIHFLPK